MSMRIVRTEVCPKEGCTLCMACYNVCPKDAISIDIDDYGYEKIAINPINCIDCHLCEKVCQSRIGISRQTASACFAAQAKDAKLLQRSASGGAFQMLAEIVLERGGVVYGCELIQNLDFQARHIRVSSLSDLARILNSKYVPSVIGKTYQEAKEDLELGRTVLFSGTPCQILGLRAYLHKDYRNLLTADIICHGVTSSKIFNDYLRSFEKRKQIQIVDYAFRDKSISWGTNYCYNYFRLNDDHKRLHTKHCPREDSSYMWHYLRGNIFRENCYRCQLSSEDRVSDFTFGDYWEIEVEHPDYILKSKPALSLRKGVSCILINSPKGEEYGSLLHDKMVMYPTTLDQIKKHNGNLRQPSGRGRDRDNVLMLYQKLGYEAIENEYQRKTRKKKYIYWFKNAIKSKLPDRIRVLVYNSPILRKIIFRDI